MINRVNIKAAIWREEIERKREKQFSDGLAGRRLIRFGWASSLVLVCI